MARHNSKVVNQLRDVDDLAFLITGRRIHNLVARGLELFGEDILGEHPEPPPPTCPCAVQYATLGVRPEAADIVVAASFRALVREYHPDTGTKPDAKKFQECVEAYNTIKAERLKAAGLNASPKTA